VRGHSSPACKHEVILKIAVFPLALSALDAIDSHGSSFCPLGVAAVTQWAMDTWALGLEHAPLHPLGYMWQQSPTCYGDPTRTRRASSADWSRLAA
jgi:hypothetical protein